MKDRLNYIGASEAAAVLGLSRWKTSLQVWAEKTGQIAPKDISDKEEVELGKELEDYVAKRFMRKTGKKVYRVNETIMHPKYNFIGCNLDRRVVGEESVLECKTASVWKYKEWEGEDIPIEYIIQVMHQLAVTGKKKGYIACLIGNHKFVWKEILRDEDMIKKMIKTEVAFWNDFIIPKVMPATISANDNDVLFQLYPKVKQGSEIALSDDANKIIESIDGLDADKKVIEKTIDQQKNELKAMLGENEIGKTKNYKVTWKAQFQRRLDLDFLKAELPEVWEKYSRPVESRVLRIIPTKGDKENG